MWPFTVPGFRLASASDVVTLTWSQTLGSVSYLDHLGTCTSTSDLRLRGLIKLTGHPFVHLSIPASSLGLTKSKLSPCLEATHVSGSHTSAFPFLLIYPPQLQPGLGLAPRNRQAN